MSFQNVGRALDGYLYRVSWYQFFGSSIAAVFCGWLTYSTFYAAAGSKLLKEAPMGLVLFVTLGILLWGFLCVIAVISTVASLFPRKE
ncbi:MAG: hypothetical protein A3J09_01635 [Candidatus Zambryskibacteria bacterium RIFCSPLOWO2_02_FULL_51_21]|uniref:Uncharacterized protein n=1 Tax=Candidatus Zambryskibacteria bacterium RIFCSPHIGHO2_02_FULL_43_37 TaxID=1802749 RepID=A0A1G2TGS6_9BACT|nr:MAG: hypothetical protein A2723_01635 [Candidatus Zambryskibacteria bacterium RIFCSPHIGHO2_01_FULL_52_18]OHA96490.1 MAG: hypothetical protein A3D49_01265 [Candidatus Zambryskibacteria bacterium RIFCSPHIGHO2_02_FULL_43_37]OHB07161.1 MAG: hypothetical protein A2944_01030 [Candidatus Zambryskibacteria bacterium RIFCSPLOWO2_01_FULL_52_12]OHB11246.1 MAG: hypothetical protein A3J09_01635 [Candidatus Zambryskibacteria bacterium RIFCSPLOWO2_02_FULL_51_21]